MIPSPVLGALARLPWQAVPQIRAHGDTTIVEDSVVVHSPLPGGVAAVVRWLFNLPSWFQIWGFVAGVIVALVIVVLLWHRRRAIFGYIASLPRGPLAGLGAFAVVMAGTIALFARVAWNYTQHNNDFCVACHVMTNPFQAFQGSAHRKLQCHDCHQQSIYASLRQVYFWVAERPQSIPPHAHVPTQVCARCHIQGNARKQWQRVIATAGHSVHLNSSNPRLRNIQCVTCHGVEIHRFLPVDQTCGQSGCHTDITIKLGKMAGQTDLHCLTCHTFTAPVAEHLAPDSAARVLVPSQKQCLACHQMRKVLTAFDENADPHHGQCGWCHNPHTQTRPADAFATCTNAGCHVRPDTLTPMHRGLPAGALARCGTCHEAHEWKLTGAACLQCHERIMSPSRAHPTRSAGVAPDGNRVYAAVAGWWTGSAGARFASVGSPVALGGGGGGPAPEPVRPPRAARADGPPPNATPRAPPAPGTDTLPRFSHRVHHNVACKSCHTTTESHGALKIRSVRDCLSCHHAAERVTDCAQCHATDSLPRYLSLPVPVRTSVSSVVHTRTLPFSHAAHTTVACRDCHVQPVTLAPKSCANCHVQHHADSTTCSDCHAPRLALHDREVHGGCGGAGCHTDAAVLALPPLRNVCLVCHQEQANHEPGKDCASCHAVSWPVTTASRPSP